MREGRWDAALLAKLQVLLGERGSGGQRAVRFDDLGGESSAFKTMATGGFAVLARGALANLALRFKDTATGFFLDGDAFKIVVNGAPQISLSASGADVTDLRVAHRITGGAVTQTHDDATEGRVMLVGDFGLGSGIASVPDMVATDIDAADMASGFFATTSSTVGAFPAGYGPEGQGITIRHNIDHFTQVWMPATSDTFYTRRYRAADFPAHSPWRPILSRDMIVGPVSETGGVPTGAVIETGANGDGTFTKTADGGLRCSHIIAGDPAGGAAWTFPTPFIAPPVVTLSPVAAAPVIAQMDAAPTATDATVSVRDLLGVRTADQIHITAIGRWF